MSTTTVSRAASPGAGLRSAVARALEALRRRHAERRAAARLHAMSDRQLADLGLHRGQIDAVVRGLGRRRA